MCKLNARPGPSILVLLVVLPLAAGTASDVVVDASRQIGKLRHLNDVDNGPLCQRGIADLSRYDQELGVRNVRLHDVPWTYDNVLDTNYVFPNWRADAGRPEAYDFTQTDFYLKTISALRINIIYRLGYSAEYKTAVHHYNPPDSYGKWSDISAHIVRHFNQGWANGLKLGIKYWEIWNEPDGRSLVFWRGSPESFYRLYENAAKKLKALDPTLKVGAPGLASDLTFLEGMIRYCHDHQVPLDFVSWHVYARDPYEMGNRARKIHQFLLKYSFPNAASILDNGTSLLLTGARSLWKRMRVERILIPLRIRLARRSM
jgi:xylan 1,4-beta-xylosidase